MLKTTLPTTLLLLAPLAALHAADTPEPAGPNILIVINAAVLPVPASMSGRSALNMLLSKSAARVDPTREFAVTGLEWHDDLPPCGQAARMIRDERFQFIVNNSDALKRERPLLLSPLADARSHYSTPSLRWSAVPGAVDYVVQIAKDGSFADRVLNDRSPLPRYVAPRALEPGTYYWRVAAVEKTRAGNFSDASRVTVRNFVVDFDPVPFSVGTVNSVNLQNGSFALTADPGMPAFDAPHMLEHWLFGVTLDPSVPGRMKTGSFLVVGPGSI